MKQFRTKLAGGAALLCAVALLCGLSGCGSSNDPNEAAQAEPVAILTFKVEGMHCQGCVGSVRNAISQLDLVQSCEVSLEGETAVVGVSDPAVESSIIDAVRELDFTIKPLHN